MIRKQFNTISAIGSIFFCFRSIEIKLRFCFFIFWLLTASIGYSQKDSAVHSLDSSKFNAHVTIDELHRTSAEGVLKTNKQKFADKQKLELQEQKFDQIREEAKNTEEYFRKGIDTNIIKSEVTQLEQLYELALHGVFTSKNKFYSERNLSTSALLLDEALQKLDKVQHSLTGYIDDVNQQRKLIDSLLVDSALYHLTGDAEKSDKFVKDFVAIIQNIAPADSMLYAANKSLFQLDKRVVKLRDEITFNIYRIDEYRKGLAKSMYNKEMTNISEKAGSDSAFNQILFYSFYKALDVVQFFADNNKGKFVFIGFLFICIYWLFSSLSKRLVGNPEFYASHGKNEIVKHPLLAATFIALNIGQFFFTFPPFASQAVIWLIMFLILIILDRKNMVIFSGKLWPIFTILLILSIIDNFMLEASSMERWCLLILSFASIVFTLIFWLANKVSISGIRILKWLLLLFILLETGSLLANIFGRYNLCKLLYTTGYFAVISAIFLYWSYQILIKGLMVNTVSLPLLNRATIFNRLKIEEDKIPQWIGIVFMAGWLVVFLRNFYFYSFIVSTIEEFLVMERTIGEYSYTLESIIVFISVLFLSGFIAKIIAILADNTSLHLDLPGEKKGGIRNWVLMIRIAIITVGILLAFAAAGIPMDRLTIIIGSLSVGIGFGLQDIVNNFISGIILAVERPVEIGDQIEIEEKTGKIKEIGIRSSKVVNFDGAEVIIPNGDLVSKHVINWTLTNNQRRVEIIVNVKYGSDLSKVKGILENVLQQNEQLEKEPAPMVLAHNFENHSIDFRLLFWCDIAIWANVKSEIILSIDAIFKEAGIEIPEQV